jgi:hypothetical protein
MIYFDKTVQIALIIDNIFYRLVLFFTMEIELEGNTQLDLNRINQTEYN